MHPPIDTVYPAVSTEFCPTAGSQHIFACGTYKLLQQESASETCGFEVENSSGRSKQTRVGRCTMSSVSNDDGGEDTLEKIQDIELPGILDMKWCHRMEAWAPLLGIADAEGFVTLHEWKKEETRLNKIHSISLGGSDVLCLSLDWSNRRWPSSGLGSLVVSLSDCSLAILHPDNTIGLRQSNSWSAHDFEPWIAAWDYWDSNIVYSGGDDVKLKGWDIRRGFDSPTFVYKRFDAGVTAIQSHPYIEHLFAAGSYDSTVRIFDTRKPSKPVAETNVGGGVWRLKWHPSPQRKKDLLAACMHNGLKILHYESCSDSEMGNASIGKQYDGHESLAYGVDWSYAEGTNRQNTLIASCSFYDHSLHLWRG
ncbi:WD-40 repeat-containing protein [Neolentinus lepideus HHB14362 ss-1]|uniref:methylated diphthine methylhydrolase n=1 Tax=Neolentinus lepideus HHB14362 ss-1 TaxID=1314782 RepID=A0A165VYE9_9AGAM|nr:WD-40 repeat-containing protein [Neolentinus lepideus HHB14362 ss-1]